MRVSTINIHPTKTPRTTIKKNILSNGPYYCLTISEYPYPGETAICFFFDTLYALQDFRDEFVGAIEQFEFEEARHDD